MHVGREVGGAEQHVVRVERVDGAAQHVGGGEDAHARVARLRRVAVASAKAPVPLAASMPSGSYSPT